MYHWNWNVVFQYRNVFIEGALVTLWLTLLVVGIGTLFGVVLALVGRSNESVVRWLVRAYVELFRALPTLVLLIWIYYVLPILTGIRLSPFATGVLALSLHLAAFVAEGVRAAIESIPRNQFESGLSLGLTPWQSTVRVVLPQTVRTMLPNLVGLYVAELKNSSLVSVIAVNELLHRGNTVIAQTFRPLEVYTAIAVMYLALIIPFVLLERFLEHRLHQRVRTA